MFSRECGVLLGLLTLVCIHAHTLELETFTENDIIMVKIGTFNGVVRNMALSMDGRVSTCDVPNEAAAFMDVSGAMLRPRMNYNPSMPCELDLYFLFTTYRQVILSHNSIVFTQEPLKGGVPCMRDSTTRGLCETMVDGITLRWFSDLHLFYENTNTVDALGVTLPPASWSQRSPKRIVDVSEAFMISRVDVFYDIQNHTIAVRDRVPGLTHKIITSLAAAIVAFLFVGRLMLVDTWKKTVAHWSMLTFALGTTVLSLSTRANNLVHLVFFLSSILVSVAHLVCEIIRFKLRERNKEESRTILQYATLKPDMAILLVALILAFYAITSHSLIVLPMLLSLMYIVKSLSEFINFRLHESTQDNALLIGCILVDIYFSGILWAYVVNDFLKRTLVATWYLQEALLLVVVVDASFYVATLEYKSR